MHKAYIGIGSNLDDPRLQVTQAIKALQQLSEGGEIDCSAIYQSTPLFNKRSKSSQEEQADYLNAVVSIKTTTTALKLLDELQKIELSQGRKRSGERWAARTLDLDLLLFDDEVIDHPRLTVPHYGIEQRNFVIYPLADLDANLVLPDGKTIRALHQSCSADGIRKIE